MKNSSILDLKTKGFVSLPYPADLRSAVVRAADSWKKFCDLPTEVKRSLPYSNKADGVGYELKLRSEGGDNKENFDITLAAEDVLTLRAQKIADPVALDFIKNVISLIPLIKPTAMEFAMQSEKAFGMDGFAAEIDQSEPNFFVRFIRYPGGQKSGDVGASAHPDQSGFTLHLFESGPGLQYMDLQDRSWKFMPVSSGETVIIPAMQMQLRSEGILKALYHRVISTPETVGEGRYSAVCFVQFRNTAKYDKDKHGRLQEFPAGFNYDMSFTEFRKLFKK